jgi:hypothetical protein
MDRPADSVASSYPRPGGAQSSRTVARTWAQSALTDLAPVCLVTVVVPTAIVVTTYELWLAVIRDLGPRALRIVASFGGTLGVLAIGWFLLKLRRALTSAASRKRFGLLWDVGTFWPRAAHPFAPPSYAERSIPELVTRVRRIVGDDVSGPGDPAVAQQRAEGADATAPAEAHRPVLLTGYSQGTPLAVAVVAQLPERVRDRVALLTVGTPVRRLYGRTFPAWFGADQLEVLERRFTDSAGRVRWRNLVRRSDYIGGWVLRPIPRTDAFTPDPASQVDVEIFDPPALWEDADPAPPPIHRHSQFFQDPQVHPHGAELAGMLTETIRQRDVTRA